jgi:pimeloyl-ACP methyl ester carboxylesterase
MGAWWRSAADPGETPNPKGFQMLRPHFRSPRVRSALGLALAAVLAATLTMPTASAASPTGRHHPAKPTIVLVHGAWADGSSWSGEVSRLQHAGYPVEVAPNPLRGVPTDAEYVKDFLATIKGPIVLVGHSYGGFVITNAATGNTQVKALVYVDAFAPAQNDSLGTLTAGSGSALEPALTDPTKVFTLRPFPGAPPGVVDTYVLPAVFIPGFGNDLPRSQAAVLAASQMPLVSSAFGDLSGPPAWKSIPSWSLVGTKDRIIPPALQLAMDKKAGAHVTKIDAGHMSLISRPGQVTRVIVEAADATS